MAGHRSKLLLAAPHATRTGSTRVLLDLLDVLDPGARRATLSGTPIAIHLVSGGPFEGALRSHGDELGPGEEPVAAIANSSLAAEALAGLPDTVPTMVYVHETAEVLRSMSPAGRRVLLAAHRVLCVSDAVVHDVVAAGVDPSRTVLLPPVVRTRTRPSPDAIEQARAAVGATPADGSHPAMILGCGEADWRKGTDLFVETAAAIAAVDETARFAWVGRRGRAMARRLDHDVERLGLTDRLVWLGELVDPAPTMAAADLVLMTSRDDPQPLVPLEAAGLGVPTVGFAIGGLCDLGAARAARVSPYPDTAALARAALEVLARRELAEALVDAACRRVIERQSIEVVGPRFVTEVEGLLASARRAMGAGAP